MARVLVTGGSRGLGLAICKRLLDRGNAVVTCARTLSPELDQLLREHPGRCEFYPADLGQVHAVEKFAKQARCLDGFSGFVGNAAVGTDGLLTLSGTDAIESCVQINLIANILLAREAVKGMLNTGGSLVFISSVAARAGFAGLSVYSATKGALISFSRSLAREYGERGIRSNCVLPGFLETEMSASLPQNNRDRIARRTALKRLGTPADILGAIEFLLSDESRYVTGTEIVADGGMGA